MLLMYMRTDLSPTESLYSVVKEAYCVHMLPRELKTWRITHNLTQHQLGTLLQVSKHAVQSWELGRRPIPFMLSLALKELERQLSKKPKGDD
jgi:DNA-binding transcriptional regulator YiaG